MRYVGLIPALILVSLSQATARAQEPETRAPDQPAAYQTQMIWFARSGKTVTVELAPTMPSMDRATLMAFGRAWTEPVNTRKQGIKFVADFKAPSVRVPTVFTIAHPDRPNQIMGELVAYPDRDVRWDEKITLHSCGAPGWFDQWASAVGLPVKQIALADLPNAKLAPTEEKGRSLLVLGSAAAGKDVPDVAKLAGDKKVNVLVLDATWFGDAAGPVNVAPAQMFGGLSEISKQRWPKPLKFSTHRKPWPGIANRWAWISDGSGLPLVEDARLATLVERATHQQEEPSTPRVVLSYIAWPDELGRTESCDEVLQGLLRSAAQPRDSLRWFMLDVLYPRAADVTGKERPVLKAAQDSWPLLSDIPARIFGVDLRGRNSPPAEFAGDQKWLEKTGGEHERTYLLILGDDKLLDEWDWLKLDRKKKTIGRAGVVWLSDDELPPSKDQQIKLMMKLTELGVPLAPILKEAKP